MKARGVAALSAAALSVICMHLAFASPGGFVGPLAPVKLVTECRGPVNAGVKIIYLHGIDPPDASLQERGNRDMLTRMANDLGFRLALARSPDPCPRNPGKRCWPNESKAAVKQALNHLLADTSSCFGGKPPSGLIGFSNGGYFVGKVMQFCLQPVLTGIIGVGGAGGWSAGEAPNLAGCGHMIMMIGREDFYTHDVAVNFSKHLVALKGKVQLQEYRGGHVLPSADLKAALASLFPLTKAK